MMRRAALTKWLGAAALVAAFQLPVTGLTATDAAADGQRRSLGKVYGGGKPQVRSFNRSVGGYSYRAQDTINTYSDNRSNFGGASTYRDPTLDLQTPSGPFDHGWFFDSGVNQRGGNSPYLN